MCGVVTGMTIVARSRALRGERDALRVVAGRRRDHAARALGAESCAILL
jgi:hypothetical protein